jgi:hypothetical protein
VRLAHCFTPAIRGCLRRLTSKIFDEPLLAFTAIEGVAGGGRKHTLPGGSNRPGCLNSISPCGVSPTRYRRFTHLTFDMAGFSPPGFGGYPPPYYSQDSPPAVNHNYYNVQAPYTTYSNAPQHLPPLPPPPPQDMDAPMQDAPVLDQNQIAYFFNQVNSGVIPPLTPDGRLPQTFQFPPPPPMQNAIPTMVQPGAPVPPMASPNQYTPRNDVSAQHHRIEDIGRSDREDGELSEEGEVSTPGSRGGRNSKRGRGSSDRSRQSRGTHQAPKGQGNNPQGNNPQG